MRNKASIIYIYVRLVPFLRIPMIGYMVAEAAAFTGTVQIGVGDSLLLSPGPVAYARSGGGIGGAKLVHCSTGVATLCCPWSPGSSSILFQHDLVLLLLCLLYSCTSHSCCFLLHHWEEALALHKH